MATSSSSNHYDIIIIGAGMSALAAGIRLAYYDKRVCIVEKHYAYGGLNSYYRQDGRDFDVGLHALTNCAKPHIRQAPLNKLLRQLRIKREELDLHEQRFSKIQFPDCSLRFTNEPDDLREQVASVFPREIDNFDRLVQTVRDFDDMRLDIPYASSREMLGEIIGDPLLIEMLLCPLMYYGSSTEHDIEWLQFVILFKSLYLEGFARPRAGVRHLLKLLVKKYRVCGGRLRMRCGVDRINVSDDKIEDLELETGETLTADTYFSSAGYPETMRLCHPPAAPSDTTGCGRLSFIEALVVLDKLPATLGHEAAIVFFNDADTFTYARPPDPCDLRSGVACCPSNFQGHEDMPEGLFRLTLLANPDRWMNLPETAYREQKAVYLEHVIERGQRFIPDFRDRIVYTDLFTPRTIERFTGRVGGAVYGTPMKRRDGRTPLSNLYLCGTDQGYLGIIGALVSGIAMANMHVLSKA